MGGGGRLQNLLEYNIILTKYEVELKSHLSFFVYNGGAYIILASLVFETSFGQGTSSIMSRRDRPFMSFNFNTKQYVRVKHRYPC